MTTKIIAMSGRKGSGKSTIAKFLVANGSRFFGDGSEAYAVDRDADGRGATFRLQSDRTVRVRTYSMADPLKRFCVDVLGLEERQVYGSEADKQTLTRFTYDRLPHWPRLVEEERQKARREVAAERHGRWWPKRLFLKLTRADEIEAENRAWLRIPTGPMTARAVLQHVGTDIFRRMWADVWNEACLRQIRKDAPDVALVDDCRFPDEVEAVQRAGGKVIRLNRAPHAADQHPSERALDDYPQEKFDVVLPDDLTERDTLLLVHYCLADDHCEGIGVCRGDVAARDMVGLPPDNRAAELTAGIFDWAARANRTDPGLTGVSVWETAA